VPCRSARGRGALTAAAQIGALVASFIGYGCFSNLTGQAQWRVQLGIQLLRTPRAAPSASPPAHAPAAAIPLALFVLLLPESPRFLALRGQPDAALATLARLHARGDAQDPFVRAQHAEILAEIESERAQGPATYGELLTTPSLLRRLVLGCALQAGLQLTGISAIEYYSPDVFAA
jgi:MFS family permease